MDCVKYRCCRLFFGAGSITLLVNLWILGDIGVKAAGTVAFPEKFLLRLSSYSIQNADTDLAVFSSSSLGTGFSFVDDLGGDDSVTVPRIDGYYRFNHRHRIEFGTFRIERDGRNLLAIDLDIGDESYSVGDTVKSKINYELLKVGYAYTIYHSQEVELSATLGLNVTDYEFDYRLIDGSSADSSRASGPLPMFGVRVSYAINPRWSVHYLSEVLFIEAGDTDGSIQNYELDFRYKLNNKFIVGAGLARFSVDVTTEDSDWNGRIADTHPALVVTGSYFFN